MPKNVSTLKYDTRAVATAAREFARENGNQVGTRGRLSIEIFTNYLLSQPATARDLAQTMDIPVSAKGRVSRETVEAIAASIR